MGCVVYSPRPGVSSFPFDLVHFFPPVRLSHLGLFLYKSPWSQKGELVAERAGLGGVQCVWTPWSRGAEEVSRRLEDWVRWRRPDLRNNIESLRWKNTSKVIESNCRPGTAKSTLNHVPVCQTYTFKYFQGWWHFPEHLLPMLEKPSVKKYF